MAENSKIGWCHHTVNLWWGCYEVHKGCDNCYAKKLANRYHSDNALWQQQGPRMYIKSAFADLKKYQARAAKEGVQYIIFMNSMSDLFEKSMPVVDFKHQPMTFGSSDSPNGIKPYETQHIREQFFNMVDDCPNLLFLLLTKRPSNIPKMVPADWLERPRANVMYGTSVVDQETADTLIPQLLKVPGYHFLSMEPLVGPVNINFINAPDEDEVGASRIWPLSGRRTDMARPCQDTGKIDWVITGGESGSKLVRPMNSQWVQNIHDQCKIDGVPFFLKQWGNWMPLTPLGHGLKYCDGSETVIHHTAQNQRSFIRSNDQLFYYTNSHNEDGLLDGIEHKNFPITVWPH